MNGSLPFEFPWTCGCVFSAQARRELAGSDACPVCSKPYDPRDIVPINALSPEIVASLHARMAERVAEREKRRADKKKLKGKPKRKRSDGGDVPPEPTPETSLGDKRTK
ncbi:Replication termination factor 2, partial [Coemansia biformis]